MRSIAFFGTKGMSSSEFQPVQEMVIQEHALKYRKSEDKAVEG